MNLQARNPNPSPLTEELCIRLGAENRSTRVQRSGWHPEHVTGLVLQVESLEFTFQGSEQPIKCDTSFLGVQQKDCCFFFGSAQDLFMFSPSR